MGGNHPAHFCFPGRLQPANRNGGLTIAKPPLI
jgi:hypothetical protein